MTPAPSVTAARCLASRERPCVDTQWIQPGGTIEITGRYLADAKTVIFYGRRGRADNLTSPAKPRRSGNVTASVPEGAHSGPLAVVNSAGVRSRKWTGLVVDEPAKAVPVPKQTGPQPAIGTAISEPHKIFYGGLQKAVFTYQVANSQPVDVTVNLVRMADGAVVRGWQQPQVAPGVPQKVIWDGTAGGKVQAEGYYSFQVVTGTASGSRARTTTDREDSVAFYGHMFPIMGKHKYSGAGGRFGAGRGGRSHQGHDVFAACGTPLVAARAGKVVYSGYHGAAGYYLVVHGRDSGLDYAYMHLRQPAVAKKGATVYTGQQIGEVGDTGNARGCHLHFELWSAPGWYKGGRPFDPLPELKRWDAVS